ncbi:Hypothetical protein CINCED_3A013389 [Cinara cedri]|uniref:Uncharacterized protein n=1 Tax=Cinara cedri TaxID=506608 RepID=A0A5E4NFW1_9HEMI|nr:Hypothetical protein CINCED_3A013389 [Cinara cedri]
MQIAIEHRSPVRQGSDMGLALDDLGYERKFTPYTEDEIIISYSLSYQAAPDRIIETMYRGRRVVINQYATRMRCKVYTHSIEQYTRREEMSSKLVVTSHHKSGY